MNNNFDLIIVGGGAAGMMTAISAIRNNPDKTVAIIDRTFKMGRKLLISGAGRCNVTNINLDDDVENRYYGSTPEFIMSIFDQYGYDDIVGFFRDLGVELYVERKTNIGKLFPVTNQAKTVLAMMVDEIERGGVQIFYNHEVKDIQYDSNFGVKTFDKKSKEKKEFTSEYLVLAAGGKTYPAYGSDGSGYALAQKFGHKLVEPVPSALSLVAKNQLSHYLQGTKLEISSTSIINGEKVKTRTDDVMFKKYGFSGPAILNISREISIELNRKDNEDVYVSLNFFPSKDKNEVREFLEQRWLKRPTQSAEKSLYGLFPNNVCKAILKDLGIDTQQEVQNLKGNEKEKLVDFLVDFRVKVTGTRGWNEAEFTAGGIDSQDVKKSTLESKFQDNLYFAGEILDVDGDVGGFNLSWSWASGWVAGKLL